jgi:outer membrane protein TolC
MIRSAHAARSAVLGLLLVAAPALAQRTMTLEECLELARKQAPELLEAEQTYRSVLAGAESSALSLRSTVDLQVNAPIYTDNTSPTYNPVTGTTDLLRQRESQYGGELILRQPIYWTGGSISVVGNLARRAQQGITGNTVNDYVGLGSVTLDQPILVPNRYRLQQRESDMGVDLAHSGYISQYAAMQFKIRSVFFALYQAEQELAIQKDVVATSQQNFDLASNKFKAGLIAEVEALQLEVDLASAKTELFDRERRLKSARRDLAIALGLPIDSDILPKVDSVQTEFPIVDANRAVREAMENRRDVLNARYEIERAEIASERLSAERAVRASLTGSFGASDNAADISGLSTDPYVNRGLTLSVSVPLFDWGAHATRMDAQDASRQFAELSLKLKEQQVQQEVRSVLEQIDAARAQVAVAERSVAVAEKAYSLSHARFDAGKITSQDLALEQQRLTRARLSVLNAKVAQMLAIADLTQKTLYDFAANRKVVVPG